VYIASNIGFSTELALTFINSSAKSKQITCGTPNAINISAIILEQGIANTTTSIANNSPSY